MCKHCLGCNDEHTWVGLAGNLSEPVFLMCPKLLGHFHPKSASKTEFIDGFQLCLVSFNVVRLPLGLASMINASVVLWWSHGQLRVILLVFPTAFGHVFRDGCRSSRGSLSFHPEVHPHVVAFNHSAEQGSWLRRIPYNSQSPLSHAG